MPSKTFARTALILFAAVIGLFGLLIALPAHGLVLAQAAPAAFDPLQYLPQVLAAVQSHHWLVVLGLAILTIVAAAGTHAAGVTRLVPWFATDAGATVWTFILASLGSLATTLAAGQTPGLPTLSAAFGVGVVAIGGYTGARKLLGPSGLGKWFPVVARVADALGPANPAPAVTK
jgi:hypothetical protein